MKNFMLGLISGIGIMLMIIVPFTYVPSEEVNNRIEFFGEVTEVIPRQFSVNGMFEDAVRYSVDITIGVSNVDYEYTASQLTTLNVISQYIHFMGLNYQNSEFTEFTEYMTYYIKTKFELADIVYLDIKWNKETIKI